MTQPAPVNVLKHKRPDDYFLYSVVRPGLLVLTDWYKVENNQEVWETLIYDRQNAEPYASGWRVVGKSYTKGAAREAHAAAFARAVLGVE